MKTSYRLCLLTIMLMISFISQAATADQKDNFPSFILAGNQQSSLSEQAAVAIAKQHINGRILAIRPVDNAYRIKILSDKGTVHIIIVNSEDGKISPSH